MELQVKVIGVLEPQSFESKKNGNTYVRHTFIGETGGQYPRKVAFTVMGDDRFNQMGIVVGGNYNVSFDVESREWQGRWFTDASAWRAQRIDGDGAQVQQPQQSQKQEEQSPIPQDDGTHVENGSDLPFLVMSEHTKGISVSINKNIMLWKKMFLYSVSWLTSRLIWMDLRLV